MPSNNLSNFAAPSAPRPEPVDVLLISERPTWPQDVGHVIHANHTAIELRKAGVRVAIASVLPAPHDTPPHLRSHMIDWPQPDRNDENRFWSVLSPLRRRFVRYFSPRPESLAGVLPLIRQTQPAAIIGFGAYSATVLSAVRALRRQQPKQESGNPWPACIWYANDELVLYQWSCLTCEGMTQLLPRIQNLAKDWFFERLFAPGLDGAVAVSPNDARMFRHVAGVRNVAVVRGGVDLDYFQPAPRPTTSTKSLAFWGRLDFKPNHDALTWFLQKIWPAIFELYPDATFRIAGKNPDRQLLAHIQQPGVELVGHVPDIRPFARAASAMVVPMRCGRGIKTKLLEAAAMGLPIIASPVAVTGLDFGGPPPLLICRKPQQWIDAVTRLWSDPALSEKLGFRARQWVERHHRWSGSVAQMFTWLNSIVPIKTSSSTSSRIAA